MSKTIKHVLTFTGVLPDDEMAKAKVLGHPEVHAARDALLVALKEAGAEHVAESKVHREMMEKRGPRTKPTETVAPIQEPDPAPVAEVPHGKRAAA